MAQYLVHLDKSKKRIYILKCTGDPTTLSNWVAQDKAITIGAEIKSMWAVLDGTDIHIATQHGDDGNSDEIPDGDGKVEYHKFSTSTDTWTIVREYVSGGSGVNVIEGPIEIGVSLSVRSDGDVIVFYSYATHPVAIDLYDVAYARREAGSWTRDQLVNAQASDDNMAGVVVKGASDRMHFFYFNDNDNDFLHRSLSSANVLDTEAVVDPAVNGVIYRLGGRGISYVDNGNTVVKAPYLENADNINSVFFNSQANPAINVDDPASGEDAEDINASLVGCYALDGTDTWLLYSGGGVSGVDQDIYSNEQADGGGWGVDTEEQDAVTCNRISAGVYDRSGQKLGYVWLDGTTMDYDEKDIGVAPPAGQPVTIRTWGTPAGAGARNRPGGWN